MGHIHDALERAAADAAGATAVAQASSQVEAAAEHREPVQAEGGAALPPGELFSAPWTFDRSVDETPRPHVAEVRAPAPPAAIFHGFDPAVRDRLVVNDAPPNAYMSVATEQYRRLAAALHHAQIDHGYRTLMVSSALAGEGKTLTCTNLALTLSESYRRHVLLIDGDLRRPGLDQVFCVPNVSGLSDGLKDDAEPRLSLLQITPTLALLPAGRPDADPMGALTSSRMRRILAEAAARFDWVIVDTPPVGLLADANLLGKMVDVALLVVDAGRTQLPVLERAVETIGRERLIGVVLNRTDLPAGTYGYRYYQYYYAGYRTKQ